MNLKQLFSKEKGDTANHHRIFSIAGLGITLLFILRFFIETNSEKGDWLQYFSIGILFPVLLMGFLGIEKYSFAHYLKMLFTFIFFAYTVWVYFDFYISLLIVAAASLVLIFNLKPAKGEIQPLPVFDLDDALLFIVSGLLAAKLYWWTDTGNYFSIYPLFILFLSLTLVYFALFRPDFYSEAISNSKSLFNSRYFHYIIALIIFALGSFRYYFLDWDFIHHWGVYVGPAQLIRQGGWLLWSVPSQYGFLSILSISVLPFESCWQSFYFLNCLLLLITAFLIFYIFYSRHPALVNFIFSLLITFASLFLFIGWVPTMEGSFGVPSAGPYRFFWIYLLLFFLFILTKKDSTNYWYKNKLKIGSLIWLFGVLWSFESAFYVSAAWFSYLFVDSMEDVTGFNFQKIITIAKKFFSAIFVSLLCFAVFIFLIIVFYKIRLGSFPDFVCFYEPALSFMGGFGGMVINSSGSVGIILLILFLIAAIAIRKLNRFSENKKEAALLVATWFGLWAALSYFAGRSHENNISNLMPLIATAAAILTFVLYKDESTAKQLVNAAMLPFYGVIFFLTYGNWQSLSNCISDFSKGYSTEIESNLGQTNPLLISVFEQIGLKETDSIAYFDDVMLLREKNDQLNLTHNYWLPLNPVTVMNPLKKERAYVYMERFVKQFHSGGWLIRRKSQFDQYMLDFGVVEKIISNYYEALPGGYEDNNWQIVKYKIKSAGTSKPFVETANDLLNQSVAAYNNAKFEECIELCRRALLIEPDNVMAYNNICSAYNSLHKYEEAIAACEKALAINPNFEIAKNNLRESYKALNATKHE